MSEKGRGAKIAIQFTDDILNEPVKRGEEESQEGTWTANGTYSGTVDTAKDGNLTTYWQSRNAANYIQIAVPGMLLAGFSVYKGDSYRPTTYNLETSDDGATYTSIKTGSFIAATGWEKITLAERVTTNYIRVKFGYSSRLYVYELKLHVGEWPGVLDVQWQERIHVGGPLITKAGKIDTFARDTEDASKLIVTMRPIGGRFNNAEGDITLTYNATLGQLAGSGGLVESFVRTFTPEDLEPVPNPHDPENIEIVDIAVTATRIRVY
jgi:hypothetical protein